MAAAGYRGAHFATFPEALVERPLLAACPEAVCSACSQPWRRQVRVRRLGVVLSAGRERLVRRYPARWETLREVGDLIPCGCGEPTRPGVVLDPFLGAGTVAVVAERLGRDWVGVEVNPNYVALATARLDAARSRSASVSEAA
jgi:hypothetical protein